MARPAPPSGDQGASTKVQQAVQSVVPDAQIGLEVFDRQAGQVVTSSGSDQQFPCMSVVKLLIALDALDDGNGGWGMPSDATQQQIQQMLSTSDDTIADNLWSADGGSALVTRMVNRFGLTGTQPPDDPNEWGDTLTTPNDLVKVYRYVTEQLPGQERDLLVNALSNTPRVASDGFDQYFGIPDGLPHTTWAIKQGWGTSGNQAVFNTTGLLGSDQRYVVVLLTSESADVYGSAPQAVTAGVGALSGLVGSAS